MSQRQILRTRSGSRLQIRGLLDSLFTAELLSPSFKLFLVSAWVRDIQVLDNRSGSFRGLDPTWGRRTLRLSEVLGLLVERGTELVLAIRPEPGNEDFAERLLKRLRSGDVSRVRVLKRSELHVKGLLGDGYAVTGSMNFTNSGVEHNEELLTYETDPERVAELRVEFDRAYGTAE